MDPPEGAELPSLGRAQRVASYARQTRASYRQATSARTASAMGAASGIIAKFYPALRQMTKGIQCAVEWPYASQLRCAGPATIILPTAPGRPKMCNKLARPLIAAAHCWMRGRPNSHMRAKFGATCGLGKRRGR